MGRPERPVNGPPHLESLALYLRSYRDNAGVTYEEMAQHVDASPATLKRTAAGATVPKWGRVMQFHYAILRNRGRTLDEFSIKEGLRDRWIMARREERGTLEVEKITPEKVISSDELKYALWTLYERAGAPPLRAVQARSGGEMLLPLSSLSRIASQQTIPADNQQMIAFLRGISFVRANKRWCDRWIEARIRATSLGESSYVPKFVPGARRIEHIRPHRTKPWTAGAARGIQLGETGAG